MKEYIVKVKKSGETIKVYKHKTKDIYINSIDCLTEYKKEELKF